MKAILVEDLRRGRRLGAEYERVYVLNETFETFGRYVSVPASLDGAESGPRDSFLHELGDLVDMTLLENRKSRVFRRLSTNLPELLPLFEMNLYARQNEIWNLAKASWLASEIERNHELSLMSALRNSSYIERYFASRLHGNRYLGNVRIGQSLLTTLNNFLSISSSAVKGWVWLFVLATRTFASDRFDATAFSGQNMVVCPVTRESRGDERTWGPYWRHFSEVEEKFNGTVAPIYFSAGIFRDHRGKTLRPHSLGFTLVTFFSLAGLIARLAFLVSSQGVRNLVRPQGLGPLQGALARSMLSPAFVQACWEHFQFSQFFQLSSPTAVLFLCEGQSWERALVTQGRKFNTETLFAGVVHNAIRPWDLRYFRPISWGLGPVIGRRSAPDLLLVTSRVCSQRIKKYYGELDNVQLVETVRFTRRNGNEVRGRRQVAVVAGTYDPAINSQLESFVVSLGGQIFGLDLRYRRHPQASSASQLPEFDPVHDMPAITITDSTSTLCIELAESQDPVLVLRFGKLPNLSPLADLPEFRGVFLTSARQLERVALESEPSDFIVENFNYFERNENFDKWRMLIRKYNL